MSKTINVTYTNPCILHNQRRGYWQCGVWVSRQEDATIYPNEEEATLVRALRHLGSETSIIRASK